MAPPSALLYCIAGQKSSVLPFLREFFPNLLQLGDNGCFFPGISAKNFWFRGQIPFYRPNCYAIL